MNKHTESPWRWDRQRDQIVAANGSVICKIATGEDRAEEDANARLIEASPDLLTACLGLVKAADLMMGPGAIKFSLDLARAAIAKAERSGQ